MLVLEVYIKFKDKTKAPEWYDLFTPEEMFSFTWSSVKEDVKELKTFLKSQIPSRYPGAEVIIKDV